MSTPNRRNFTISNILSARSKNDPVAAQLSSVYYKYPHLIPVHATTGSIDSFYFNDATGSTLYLTTLTGPVLSQIGGVGTTGATGPTGNTGPTGAAGTFNPGDNITTTTLTATNIITQNLTSSNITGTTISSTSALNFISATGTRLYTNNLVGIGTVPTLIFHTFFTRGTTNNTLSAMKIYFNTGAYVQGILYPTDYTSLLGSQVGSDILSISYNNVARGTLSCPYTRTFICPYNGNYNFNICGWKCASGNAETRVSVNRSGSNIYDRKQQSASISDCGYFIGVHYLFNLQTNDVCQFFVNENITFSPTDLGPIATNQKTEGLTIFCMRTS